MAEGENCVRCGKPLNGRGIEGACEGCFLLPPIEDALAPIEPPSIEALAEALPRYEFERLLGRGALGAVYLARDTRLSRPVAIKACADNPDNPEFAIRFGREASAMAQLSHRNIATVYDHGRTGALLFIAMEYVSGGTLGELLEASRRLPLDRAVEVSGQVCDALQYAHSMGVVHRDVKPDNVLLDAEGNAKLTDFGLVKGLTHEEFQEVAMTRTNIAVGTPRYMAPEQLENPKGVDHRADIYSAGAMFYEMLTGDAPRGRYRPASKTKGVPRSLDRVIHKALVSSPDDRYDRASGLKSDLEAILKRLRQRKQWMSVGLAYAAVAGIGWWAIAPDTPGNSESPTNAVTSTPEFKSLPLGSLDDEIDLGQWQVVADYQFNKGPEDSRKIEPLMTLDGGASISGGMLVLNGLGDEGHVMLANADAEGEPQAVAIDAKVFVSRYAGFKVASPMIVKFSQRWDAGIFVGDQKWHEGAPLFLGGAREPLAPVSWSAPFLPAGEWLSVWMMLDAQGYRIWVNDRPALRVEDLDDFNEWESGNWYLGVGDFEGKVDYVRVLARA